MCKISVIVPVYKVEQYLARCVDSILRQTFGDFELLLVDDGSPDNAGRMCDEYAEKDARVRVIHKTNGGLSDARNAGIEAAQGAYLTFVDSDDWVADDMLAFLYGLLEETGADMAACGHLTTAGDIPEKNLTGKTIVLRGEEAQAYYLEKELVSACGKLFRRELFATLRFPVGHIYEDVATIYRTVIASGAIAVNSAGKYYYFREGTSITRSSFQEKNLDYILAYEEVAALSAGSGERVRKLADIRLKKTRFSLLVIIAKYGFHPNFHEPLATQKRLLRELRQSYGALLVSPLMSMPKKIAMTAMCVNFSLFCRVARLFAGM